MIVANTASSPEFPFGDWATPNFDDVYAVHHRFVWRCLRNLGVADHALEDATQEVFVVVHRRLSEYRPEAKLRTWIFAIARRVAGNQRRSHRRQRSDGWPEQLQIASGAADPHEQLAERESAKFVQKFLQSLDTSRREVFMLVMLEEIPVPEVAEMLGIPVNTAYTRLRAARLAFRRALGRRSVLG